ncbi:aerobic respiration control sensor protein ArcB [mine drainage metagenome]|uniref:Aerobic respiration control sensor protein ArcB n=1 Tax=mine drainage metagenome TaxID=410659 RepID=A0A1J5PBN0_9ZZZZ
MSRPEEHAVPVDKKPFALSVLFEQLAQDLGVTAQDKGLRLHIRASRHWVLSDATLVYRILLNLVGNALRYTERGGVLVVARPAADGQTLQLQVWDSGVGIAPQYQSVVFAEFFQVANAARDRTKGLGLGLNIVQRTAALLAHPLQLASRLGHGTRVSLVLPLAQPQLATAPEPALESALADDLRDVLVLVIEDDTLVMTALTGVLQAWGMHVLAAQGLPEALQLLAQGDAPELIISDFRLQDAHDGIAVIVRLRSELGCSVPACLISGDIDAGLVHAAQDVGLTLLHKPVRPGKLRSLLRSLLRDQRAGQDALS